MFKPLESDLQEIVRKSHNTQSCLRNANVLILGAQGFIGKWLVSSLLHLNSELALNLQVVGIVRDDNSLSNQEGRYREYSLASWQQKNVNRDPVTHVFHCATNTRRDHGVLKLDAEGIIELTHKTIQGVSEHGNVPVFVHLSSGAVYGDLARNNKLIQTSAPIGDYFSLDSYARVKVEIEKIVVEATSKGKILGSNPRLFSFIGPGLSLESPYAIASFVSSAIDRQNVVIKGSPLTERTYLYPTDLVTELIRTASSPSLEITHIGGGEKFTMLEIAQQVSKIWKVDVKIDNKMHTKPNYYNPEILENRDRVQLSDALERWRSWLERL